MNLVLATVVLIFVVPAALLLIVRGSLRGAFDTWKDVPKAIALWPIYLVAAIIYGGIELVMAVFVWLACGFAFVLLIGLSFWHIVSWIGITLFWLVAAYIFSMKSKGSKSQVHIS